MGRLAILIPLVLLATACTGQQPRHPLSLRASAGFAGPDAMVVEVRVFEIPPGTSIERVVLLAPTGERLAARELVRSVRETGPGLIARPRVGLAVTGGSSSGVTPALSLGYGIARAQGSSLRTRQVSALITLPDPAAYRATAPQWRIEVHYVDVTGDSRVHRLPAPGFE